MVKADPKRDYYADLDLPPDADEDQIKRQFRLLAKAYHPDRNPGHEVEFVSKFQAVQAAHEILSDPAEKVRYDAARANNLHRASEPKFPPPPKDDPYNFRRPSRAQTTNFAPPPKAKPNPRPTPQQAYATPRQGPAPSPGAEKLSAFARTGAQRWDRQGFENASRHEGMRGFQRMPAGGGAPTPMAPPMPPRATRQHPTAPRPSSNQPIPEEPNGNPGFPGLSRTNSARRMQFPDEKPPPRSAYNYVRGDRPPSSTAAHSYDTFTPQSPPLVRAQAADQSPLRHSRSTEQTRPSQRPTMYERQAGRYSSNTGEKTDIRGGLGRSASVRNSPVDPEYDTDSGPFGTRPHSHHYGAQSQPPRPRHRSASPKLRQASYSSTSSDDDEPAYVGNPADRPRAEPRSRRPHKPDGLDTFFPSSNYTRVVEEQPLDSGTYRYPPPPSKDAPVRQPFPNMTSPDEPKADPRNSFSTSTATATAERPTPDPVFQPAKFQHEDWAERLRQERNASPTKQQRGSKSRDTRRPTVSTSNSGDAMEVDPTPTDYTKPHTNGNINLDDLKSQAPLKSNGGLHGMADDLKSDLPFESRASALPPLHKAFTYPARIKPSDLPRPPKLIHPPAEDGLDRHSWQTYVDGMKHYVSEWATYEEKMIDHFHTRNRLVRTMMADNWVTSPSDGPPSDQIDERDFATGNTEKKAGFGTYMEWLADDQVCHVGWQTACERHSGCMEELGRVRTKIKSMAMHDN